MVARRAAAGWTLAAILSGLALAVSNASARPAGAPPQAVAARAFAGGIDADVRARNSGRLLGHLHGDVATSGRGAAVFTPAPRRHLAGDRLAVAARVTGARRASMRAGGFSSRLRFRIRRDGTVRGRGRLKGRPVRIVGVARDPVPRLRKGLRMLVVGRPHGEGYETLKRFFRPVRYRPRHTRARFLRRRREFHSFGALVFGGGLGRERIAEHRLLRTFYGAGKWVVAAPAPLAAQRGLGAVHPYVGGRAAPAVAVRQVGPAGDAPRVKATVAYPEPGKGRRTAAQRRQSARNRAEFFLSQLRRMATPHMTTARRPGAGGRDRKGEGPRAAQLSRSPFTLPLNAAALEMMVTVYHEFTMSGSQNAQQSKPCGWDLTLLTAWCEDEWTDEAPWRPADDKAAACQYFMRQGYHILDMDSVKTFARGKNAAGQYTDVKIPDQPSGPFDNRFYRQAAEWGDECPRNGTQMGNIQGTDYYYAILEPDSSPPAHTIVASSDLTVNATNPPSDPTKAPTLAFQGGYNGRGRMYEWLPTPVIDIGGRWDFDGAFPRETAWFLGAYDSQFTLSGANVGTSQFEYQQTQSVPQNRITEESSSTGYSTATSFNVGIFDDVYTGGFEKSEEEHADITIAIPSWEVIPSPGGRTITYNWRTNTPVSWATIAGGGGGPHDLNPLNITDFGPSSITSWSGNPTWGKVSIGVNRTVHLIDHSSHYDRGSNSIVDGGYHDTQLHYTDGPDDIAPSTKASIGAGINFCDPVVMWAKQFWAQCAGLQAVISVTAVCSKPTWTNISFEVGAFKTPNLSCNQQSDPVPVGAGNDVDVEFLTPSFATAGSATCTDENGAVVAKQSSGATITIPGRTLKPKTQIACKMNLTE